jgi:non-heme chloroperoxidase
MADPTGTPVVFIHGLWMHTSSWDRWMQLFSAAGYLPMAPGWPGDAATVAESRANPDPIANRGIAEVTDHYAEIIRGLPQPPVLIGHSFGGMITQKLLGMGLGCAGVAISPAQFKGVYRLPPVQLRTGWPVLGNPGNKKKAVLQTPEQFHRGFASEVSREESDALYEQYVIPAPALPLFEAASANLSRKSGATIDLKRERGPLLLIGGEKDRTVPQVIVRSEYKLQQKNPGVTEYEVFNGRGHSQQMDSGWRELADTALAFLMRQGVPGAGAAPETIQLPDGVPVQLPTGEAAEDIRPRT